MAENYTAGRLLVAVVPDMRGSAAKIRKEFSGIGPFDVRINAEVDDTAVKQLRAALRALPDVVVTADTSAADRDLAKLRARIRSLSDEEVGVTISAEDARREVDTIRRDLDRLSDAGVTVDADTSAARAALSAVSTQLGRVHGRAARVKVDADTAGASAKVAAFQKQIGLIRDVRAAIVYDVRIGPALRQIALLNAALVGIPAVVGASVYSVASLGAALAPTIGSLALLPAVIGAAGIAFAGLRTGMAGFGEAMKNLDDPEKFAEAIAKLSPAAREAAVAVRGLRPAWTEMQQAVQEELFAGVARQIRDLSGLYLPLLREGLTGTAGALNEFALNFAAFARAPQTLADVPVIFGNTNTALSNLSPVVNNVLGAFRDMAVVGSTFLPGLATGAVNATQRFQTFIHTARESGQLAIWIQSGIDALRMLGSIIGNVGSAFGGLFRAANAVGADFLGTLDVLTGRLAAFLNSAEGQTALVALFRNIQDMTTAMGPGIDAVLGMVGDLLVGLAPILPQVGEAFSAIAIALRPLLGLLIDLASTVLPPLLDLIIRFPGAFIGVALAVGGLVLAYRSLIAISGIITATQKALAVVKASTLLPAIWGTVTALWAQAAAFMAAYWPVLLIIGVIALLVGAVIYAWNNFEWFRNVVTAVFNAVTAAALWLWQTILVPAFQAIGAAAMWLWTNAIQPAFTFIWTLLQYVGAIVFTILVAPLILAWNLIAAAAMWLWSAVIQPVFNAIGMFIGWVWTALIQPALAALVWFWQYVITPAALWLWNTILRPTFNAIGTFIVWVWTALILPALAALVGFWNNILAPAALWLWNSVIKPAWEGIGNIIRWVWENVISPAFEAVKTGLQWVGEKFDVVTNWIGDIWNKIRGFLAKPINFMIGTVWNQGIVPAWNRVADLLPGVDPIGPLDLIPEAATGGEIGRTGGTRRQGGGMLSGPGSGVSDDILGMDPRTRRATAWVSDGEFVVRESVAARVPHFLHALNAGQAEAIQAAGGTRARMPGFGKPMAGFRRARAMQALAGGGPVLEESLNRARAFAQGESGKPYQWGGVGNPSWDCSGFMSGITLALNNRPTHGNRLGTTATFPWGGFAPGLLSAFAIGNSKSGGHMAGTLAGVNVESGGSKGVHYGGAAIGADNGFFQEQYHLPVVGGDFVSGGQGGGGGLSSLIRSIFEELTDPPINALRAMMGDPPPQWRKIPPEFITNIRDKILDWLFSQDTSSGGVDISGISGPVVDQVRQVAAQFGWGEGPEWDAIMQLVNQESTWDPGAANPYSSARGLFQKMTSLYGPVEPTPAGQAAWGLGYIRDRYGSPSAAWAFHRANGSYDSGGIARGKGLMFKDVIADERVLDPIETEHYDVLADYRRMLDEGRLVPARGLDPAQVAALGAAAVGGGREMHLHVHGDVNDPMDVDSLYNQIDFRERSASL